MKKVLITGASRGIGLELARQECAAGSRVLAACRDPEGAEGLGRLSEEFPGQVVEHTLDVESEESVKTLFHDLEAAGDTVDCLYNNAGIIDWRTMIELEAASMEKIYKVH